MPQPALDEADARLDRFLDHVTTPLRNKVQRATFAEYAVGLLSDAERKSSTVTLRAIQPVYTHRPERVRRSMVARDSR